jgi:glycosyltransferase involved in cell wall biosynthesis
MSKSSTTSNATSSPVVAVIIPCHNHACYLPRAMASVSQQDYENKMIVIVDDGSDDNSFEVAKSSMTHISEESLDKSNDTHLLFGVYNDTPVIISSYPISKKQAHARNIAIQLAWQHAELFCQLDADDLYLPKKLSMSVDTWKQNPNFIGLVYSDALIYDERD